MLQPGAAEGFRPLVEWTAGPLSLGGRVIDQTVRILSAAPAASDGSPPAFGYEIHHDGSGRIDLSVFEPAPAGRIVRHAGAAFVVGDLDVVEHDLDRDGARAAGVFHHVLDADLPADLRRWGTPLLVAVMAGRSGQLRLILPIPDPSALQAFCRELRRSGTPPDTVRRLAAARPLLTSPDTLRLGIDVDPATRRIGPRVGLEVVIDPGVFDVGPTLSAMEVPSDQIARLRALARSLPVGRRRHRGLPGLPPIALTPVVDGIGFVHLGISWPGDSAVLKSYVMVRSGPQQTPAQRRDVLVRRAGRPWTQRLRWAKDQLPLVDPPLRAREDVDRWEVVVDQPMRGLFRSRLERDGLDRARALVAVSPYGPVTDPDPPWWEWYRLVVGSLDSVAPDAGADDGGEERLTAPGRRTDGARRIPYERLWWPVAESVWRRLEAAEGSPLPALEVPVQQGLRRDLVARLSRLSSPTLARAEPSLGPADDGLVALLADRPVLGSLLASAAQRWGRSVVLMVERVTRDRRSLQALGVPVDAMLTGAHALTADTYDGGRAAYALDVGGARVAYEPRDVRFDVLCARALEILAEAGTGWSLRAPAVHAGRDADGAYGYREQVPHRPCAGDSATCAPHRDTGRVLAVLDLLGEVDPAFEDLLAHAARLAGATTSPAGHSDEVVAGFVEAHGVLRGRPVRDRLSRLLAASTSVPRRVFVRPTRVYAEVLAASLEPDSLASAVEHALVLERLTTAHLQTGDATSWPIVAAERDALARGDLPFFESMDTGVPTQRFGGWLDYDPHRRMRLIRAAVTALTRSDGAAETKGR